MINLAFPSDQKSTWDGKEGEKIEFEKKLFVIREVKKGDVQKIFHDFFTVLLILLTRSI